MSRQASVLKELIFTGKETEKQAIAVTKGTAGARVYVGVQRRNLSQNWWMRVWGAVVKDMGFCSLFLDISFFRFPNSTQMSALPIAWLKCSHSGVLLLSEDHSCITAICTPFGINLMYESGTDSRIASATCICICYLLLAVTSYLTLLCLSFCVKIK